jgi:hypothetical protein
MGGHGRICLNPVVEQGATSGAAPTDGQLLLAAQRRRHASLRMLVYALMALMALLFLIGSATSRAEGNDREQMKGLDEQVQEIKSDVLGIAAELGQLEEKLLYPSGTQVAVFVALAPGDTTRLDAVRIQIDGQLVAHYIYSFKELDALRKGGVQRLYVGNVATGDHRIDVQVDGKSTGGEDFNHAEQFSISKGVGPKMVGLTLAGPGSGRPQVELGNW